MHFIAIEDQSQSRSKYSSRPRRTENPVARRTSRLPSISEDSRNLCLVEYGGSISRERKSGATRHLFKILTLLLTGFGAGLVYHIPRQGTLDSDSNSTFPSYLASMVSSQRLDLNLEMKSRILQVNHSIVQQLRSENQQHEENLEFFRQQLAQRQQMKTENATEPRSHLRTKDDTHGVRLKGVHPEVVDLLRTSHQKSR